MSFVSVSFLILLAVTLIARLGLNRLRTRSAYPLFLLGASILFYASYIPRYVFLLLAVTLLDFYVGLGIASVQSKGRKKALLALSILSNVGILAFYKYSAFLIDNIRIVSSALDVPVFQYLQLNLALPLGISFFVFQSMSYNLDVYRGVIEPERRYWRFLLFVSFFTHLISGPIVRARELLYQFERKRRFRAHVIFEGIYFLILGFFLKKVVADNLAYYVNNYWRDDYLARCTSGSVILLSVFFACQIFADFAGYTSIAWGSAYLLGFRLPKNFNNPYLAVSFQEFWTRWHITLSRWIRDYIYIPLGGNRVPKPRLYANLAVVMLLAGLWHGAAWTFIVWGAIHGLALILERTLGLHRTESKPGWMVVAWFLVVQSVVLLGWVLFRSGSFDQALLFLGRLGHGLNGFIPATELLKGVVFVTPIVLMHGWGFLRERKMVPSLTAVKKAVLCAFLFFCVWTLSGGESDFIYFHF